MKLTDKKIRRTRCFFITLAVICITPLCERGRLLSGASSNEDYLSGKDLVCAIDLGDDMLNAHGLETGFTYELLNRFAQENNCSVSVVAGRRKNVNYLDSLKAGKIDLLVMHHEDFETSDGLNISYKVDECSAWAVGDKDLNAIRQINGWLSYFTETEEFAQIEAKYHKAYNPIKRAEKGVRTHTVSPYDHLFRKYAKDLGWDWRMLAAVVYQESKFSINSRSHRGASGLMQVMPRTGETYDVHNLLDPEQNLYAGTRHLKRLQKMYTGKGMSQDEIVKFTLAAYNAGEGRIKDCRSFAASQNIDNNSWSEIVKIIPLMREESILEEPSVKLGKFQGYETIAYVDNIMEIYSAICTICPEK